jgi:hypothetical protein
VVVGERAASWRAEELVEGVGVAVGVVELPVLVLDRLRCR